jgi:hypothetical protein
MILLVFTLNVSAIGITPARTTMDFSSNYQKNVSFSVVNSEKKDMSVVFYVRGDLKDYVKLNTEYAEFKSNEESKSFFILSIFLKN